PHLNAVGPLFLLIVPFAFYFTVRKQRFLDIRLVASKTSKMILNITFSTLISLVFYTILDPINNDFPFLQSIIASVAFVLLFLSFDKHIQPYKLFKIFGSTESDSFKQAVEEFERKNQLYGSLNELEQDISETFKNKLHIDICKIIAVTEKTEKLYPEIMSFFSKGHDMLIYKELQFADKETMKNKILIEELCLLGEICIPLYSQSKSLSGLLVLGAKPFDDLYFKEEIEALKNLQSYLEIIFMGVMYSSELKQQVKQKTKKLKKQFEKIQALVRQQSDFIAVTAHEVRTPLSIAKFQLEDSLSTEKGGKEVVRDMKTIESSISDLEKLTESLFEVQQYDLNKVFLSLKHCSINTFFNEVFKKFEVLCKDKSIKLEINNRIKKNVVLELDEQKIKQVLINLFGNALKHTKKNGRIVFGIEQRSKKITISICDLGAGIPDEKKEIIFEKFQMTKSSMAMGIGLGLYISKRIIEMHKGKIWVEDNKPKGSKFIISLPLQSV
ncbi:HAMP domain-containing histidine kinase, partial [Candidatus Peregrinibacteria bacterium]|nr:HAMP domain-containing histidine kinase [Candidatus Peregrinibacteria bacterium]